LMNCTQSELFGFFKHEVDDYNGDPEIIQIVHREFGDVAPVVADPTFAQFLLHKLRATRMMANHDFDTFSSGTYMRCIPMVV